MFLNIQSQHNHISRQHKAAFALERDAKQMSSLKRPRHGGVWTEAKLDAIEQVRDQLLEVQASTVGLTTKQVREHHHQVRNKVDTLTVEDRDCSRKVSWDTKAPIQYGTAREEYRPQRRAFQSRQVLDNFSRTLQPLLPAVEWDLHFFPVLEGQQPTLSSASYSAGKMRMLLKGVTMKASMSSTTGKRHKGPGKGTHPKREVHVERDPLK